MDPLKLERGDVVTIDYIPISGMGFTVKHVEQIEECGVKCVTVAELEYLGESFLLSYADNEPRFYLNGDSIEEKMIEKEKLEVIE